MKPDDHERLVRDTYYDNRNDSLGDVQDVLMRDWPEIAAAARMIHPPPVRLLCPRGHGLLRVVLGTDPNWHPFLAPYKHESIEGGAKTANGAEWIPHPEEEAFNEPHLLRVRLSCRKCRYRGVHLQERLLKLYAVALRHQLGSIKLPT